jgi:hypothetical protein
MAVRIPWEDPSDSRKGQRAGQDAEPGFNVLLAALLPLLGGIVYVILRGNYAWVYSRFGATPEDVGIDLYIVLTGTARILRLGNWRPFHNDFVYLLTRAFILVAVILAPIILRVWAKRDLRSSGRVRKWVATTSMINFAMAYVVALFAITILVFLLWVPRDGERAFERIGKGMRVRPGDFSFLSVHAYHADVLWIGEKRPPQLPNNNALVYLGRAGGQVVVYDCTIKHTWHMPESSVLIELEPVRQELEDQTLCPG